MFEHNFLLLDLNVSILEQLKLEEAILRAGYGSWCVVNKGSIDCIVMGLSGKLQELVTEEAIQDNIPIIKRYSGGGTVFVDSNTLFVTWIFHWPTNITVFPDQMLEWTHKIYSPFFGQSFNIQGFDYTLANKKIGGNAQYIQKNKAIHHTSFLWKYNIDKITKYLKIPIKQPIYRDNRSHNDFITEISNSDENFDAFYNRFLNYLKSSLTISSNHNENAYSFLNIPHRKSTTELFINSSNNC